jgi:hypothetical protein
MSEVRDALPASSPDVPRLLLTAGSGEEADGVRSGYYVGSGDNVPEAPGLPERAGSRRDRPVSILVTSG